MDFSPNAVKQRVLDRVRKKKNWARVLPFSTNMYMIEAFAEEINEVARFDEYLTVETKFDLARNVSSVVTGTGPFGYVPHRKMGSKGLLQVSANRNAFPDEWIDYITYKKDDIVRYENRVYKSLVDNNYNTLPTNPASWVRIRTTYYKNISIPKYSTFSTNSGIKYTSIESRTLTPSDDYVDVPVIQGVYKSLSFISTGAAFEEFEIDNDSVDNSQIEIFVDNVKIEQIDNILYADSTELRFQVENKVDFSGIYLIFGDGNTGKKLNPGQTVHVKFIETEGEIGDVVSKGSIEVVNSTFYDIDNNPIQVFCFNNEEITGGKNYETIKEIKANARRHYQAANNIISSSDYVSFLFDNFDFIGNAIVWGAYEQNKDAGNDLWTWIPTEENLVYISAFTTGTSPSQLNDTQKVEIIEKAVKGKSPRDIIKFENVDFVNLRFETNAKVKGEQYLLSEVKTAIENKIWEEYNIKNFDFKQDLYETIYLSDIQKVDGVLKHNTSVKIFNEMSFSTGDSSTAELFTTAMNLSMLPKQGSIKVYAKKTDDIEWTLIGQEVQGGEEAPILGVSPYDLSGSSVNYLDGSVSIIVDGLVGIKNDWTAKVVYEYIDRDLILSKRNQIFYLKEVNVTTYY